MIDSDSLRTASLYINNQLLSRGLLRDGRIIDFDRPHGDDYELADTMGRIMSVVNDLILRRDVRPPLSQPPLPPPPIPLTWADTTPSQRDAEHRESLSNTLRTLRADSLRQTDHLSRLQDRYIEAQRKVDIADAQEAALQAQLKAAEATIHKLKDDAARTKKLVAETRATCANDVRKRDRQIEALRKAVVDAGRARGERKSPGITTIHVTGEVGGEDASNAVSTMDDGYDLRQESNGFLAKLAKGLSEENETMMVLIRQTFDSLKDMTGWRKDEDETDGGGAVAAAAAARPGEPQAVALPANPEDLVADLEGVLNFLRAMLSNPAFAPIEDLEVRDQEILRLRDGWEKMELRWQEAVRLIDGWRRRMAADGRPVDMEDLKMGLRLSPVCVRNFAETAQNEPFKLSTLLEEEEEAAERSSLAQPQGSPSPPESLHLVPADYYQEMVPEYQDGQHGLNDSDSESSIFQDDVDGDVDMDEEEEEPNFEILQHSATDPTDESPSMPLPPPPKITALEETNVAGNRRPSATVTEKSRKRSGNLIEDTLGDADEAPAPPPHITPLRQSPQKRLKTSRDVSNEPPQSRSSSDIFLNSDSSLDSILLLEPSLEFTVSKASGKATARSTRPAATSAKPAPAPARTVVKTARTAAVEKKETPAKTLTRQRSTRVLAPTASSSSSRTARSKPGPVQARAATASSTGDMPPPPRPTRSSSRGSPALQPKTSTQADKRSSPADRQSALVDTNVSSTSTTKRSQPPPESPARSPPKSSSRLPRKASHLLPASQQSPITVAGIAAKLAASERDANAARVRAKLKAAKMAKSGVAASVSTVSSTSTASGGDPIKRSRDVSGSTGLSTSTGNGSVSMDENGTAGGVSIIKTETSSAASSHKARDTGSEEDGRETIVPSPAKRRREAPPPAATPRKGETPVKDGTGKRKREVRSRAERVASRRRSTLSPWELQSLIAGEVPVPSTPGLSRKEV